MSNEENNQHDDDEQTGIAEIEDLEGSPIDLFFYDRGEETVEIQGVATTFSSARIRIYPSARDVSPFDAWLTGRDEAGILVQVEVQNPFAAMGGLLFIPWASILCIQ